MHQRHPQHDGKVTEKKPQVSRAPPQTPGIRTKNSLDNASGNSLYISRENALQDAALSRKPSVQQVGGNDKQERRQKNPEKKALPGAKHRGPRDKASADQEIEPHPRRRKHIGEKGPVGDGAVRKNRDGPDMHQNHQKTGQDSEKLHPGILPLYCFSRITHHSNHSLFQKQSSIRNQNPESCRDPSFPLRYTAAFFTVPSSV